MNKRLGLIGCGNMGSAILSGLIGKRILGPGQIYVYDNVRSKRSSLSKKYRVRTAKNNLDLVKKSEIVLLAIKPQDLYTVSKETRDAFNSRHTIISILAGTPIQKLKRAFGTKTKIVRAMPNLGAQVGESVTAVTGNKSSLKTAQVIFLSCGEVILLPEKYFDSVTAISGSGPAYFFLMMELLTKAGMKKGISKQSSELLAIQTAVGAAKLARQLKSPEHLRKQVTSKKGTTDAALQFLWKKKFPAIFLGAIDQAVKRAKQLSKP